MGALIDLTGQKFGLLTVLSFHGVNADGKALWLCLCTCGNTKIERGLILRKGSTSLIERSCTNHPSKICTVCKIDKNKSEYHKCKQKGKDGIANMCKECKAKWYENNIDIQRRKYHERKEGRRQRRKEISKKSRSKPEQIAKAKLYKEEYHKRPEVKLRDKKTHKQRFANDLNYQIKTRLRWRLRDAIRYMEGGSRRNKHASSLVLLGCDIAFFRAYIESKFTEGMNWERFAYIDIDHIKPCVLFDLTDPKQQRECFHYSNLQPLWYFDNRKKWANYNHPNKV